MKDTKVLEQVKLYSSNTTDVKSQEQFRKMQQFIDAAIQNALSQDGPEKTATLVTALLSLRDFLANDIFENSFKVSLLKNIQNLQEKIEEQEEQEETKSEVQDTSEAVIKAPAPVIKKKEKEQEQR
jgi:hypothetical protein